MPKVRHVNPENLEGLSGRTMKQRLDQQAQKLWKK